MICTVLHEQVHVIGHQYVSVQGTTLGLQGLAENVQVDVGIFGGEEAGLPVVAALNDVLRDIFDEDAGMAWHWVVRSVDRWQPASQAAAQNGNRPRALLGVRVLL